MLFVSPLKWSDDDASDDGDIAQEVISKNLMRFCAEHDMGIFPDEK